MLDSSSVLKMELKTILIAIVLGLLQTPKQSRQTSIEYGSDFLTFNSTFHEVFPNSAFKCPEQYFIWSINIAFQSINQTKSYSRKLTSSYSVNDTTLRWRTPGPCETIGHCLGYQACLFKFGNEFCRKDPMPSHRKIMLVNYTCASDDFYAEKFLPVLPPHPENPRRRNRHVLFMNARTLTDEDLLKGNYRKAKISFHVNNEVDVFMIECPPAAEARNLGFYGNCSLDPPSGKRVAEEMWRVLGRIDSPQCRQELLDVYCAHKYSKRGDCIPPSFVEKKNSTKPPFSFESLPKKGFRPDATDYVKVHRDPHMGLIPARIGFFLLVHSSPEAVFQLFEQIYRPHHYYVIHVDKRATQVSKRIREYLREYHNTANIRILSHDRSFPTSWGSFQILRAELECYEELLRMGLWDFVVNLSGADLALRDVDDLAAALAPHRAHNFLRLNKPIWFVFDKPSRFAWYSCGAHVYNVTAREPKVLQLSGSSQFKIISRDFANFLVSSDRGDAVNGMTFYLQTSLIPDESYIPTILKHSPFRLTLLFSSTTLLKPFEGENANMLCRHSDDVDLCGRGPGLMTSQDFPDLQYETNHFYFARKFSPNPEDRTRLEVLNWAADGYYEEVSKILPRNMLGQMGEIIIEKLKEDHGKSYLIQDIRFRLFRKLTPSDPCCRQPHTRSIKYANEYSYWLDMEVVNTKDQSVKKRLRASLDMIKPSLCYPGGHLRMLNVNTRPDSLGEAGPDGPPPLAHNFPVPVQPAGGVFMWVNLFLHLNPPSKSCTDTEKVKNANNRKYYSFPHGSFNRTVSPDGQQNIVGTVDKQEHPSAHILTLFITVMDPQGNVHCSKDAVMDMSALKIPEQENSTSYNTVLHCDTFYEGMWTVKVRDLKDELAFNYKLSVYLYNEQEEKEIPYDIVKKFWTVTDMMFLPERDYYSTKRPDASKKMNIPTDSRAKQFVSVGIKPKTVNGAGNNATPKSSKENKQSDATNKANRQEQENEQDSQEQFVDKRGYASRIGLPELKLDLPKIDLGLPEINVDYVRNFFIKTGFTNEKCMNKDSKQMQNIVKSTKEVRSAIYEILNNEEAVSFMLEKVLDGVAYLDGGHGGVMKVLSAMMGDDGKDSPGRSKGGNDSAGYRGTDAGDRDIVGILQSPLAKQFLLESKEALKEFLMESFGKNKDMENRIRKLFSMNFVDVIPKLLKKYNLKDVLGDKRIIIQQVLAEFSKSKNKGELLKTFLKDKGLRDILLSFLKDGDFSILEKDISLLEKDTNNFKDITSLKSMLLENLGITGEMGKLVDPKKKGGNQERGDPTKEKHSQGDQARKQGEKSTDINDIQKIRPTRQHMMATEKVKDILVELGLIDVGDRQNYIMDEPIQAVMSSAVDLTLQVQALLKDDEVLSATIGYVLELLDVRIDNLKKWTRGDNQGGTIEDFLADVVGSELIGDYLINVLTSGRFAAILTRLISEGQKSDGFLSVFKGKTIKDLSQMLTDVTDSNELRYKLYEFVKSYEDSFDSVLKIILTDGDAKERFQKRMTPNLMDITNANAKVERTLKNLLQLVSDFEVSLRDLESIKNDAGEDGPDEDQENGPSDDEDFDPTLTESPMMKSVEQENDQSVNKDGQGHEAASSVGRPSVQLVDENGIDVLSDQVNDKITDNLAQNNDKEKDSVDSDFVKENVLKEEIINEEQDDSFQERTKGLPEEVLTPILSGQDKKETIGLPFFLGEGMKAKIKGYFTLYSKTCTMGDCLQLSWMCMKSNPAFAKLKTILAVIAGAAVIISILSVWIFKKNGSTYPAIVWILSCVSLMSSSALFVMIHNLSGTDSTRDEL